MILLTCPRARTATACYKDLHFPGNPEHLPGCRLPESSLGTKELQCLISCELYDLTLQLLLLPSGSQGPVIPSKIFNPVVATLTGCDRKTVAVSFGPQDVLEGYDVH